MKLRNKRSWREVGKKITSMSVIADCAQIGPLLFQAIVLHQFQLPHDHYIVITNVQRFPFLSRSHKVRLLFYCFLLLNAPDFTLADNFKRWYIHTTIFPGKSYAGNIALNSYFFDSVVSCWYENKIVALPIYTERQAWCNLPVKLCDPCLSALRLNAV